MWEGSLKRLRFCSINAGVWLILFKVICCLHYSKEEKKNWTNLIYQYHLLVIDVWAGTLFLTHLVKFGRAFFFGFLLFTVWQEDRGGLRTSSFLVTMMMLCCCLSVSKKLYVWDGHGPKTWIEFELNWQSTCLPGFYQWLDEITSSPYLEKTHYDRTGSTEKFNNICRPFPSLDKDMDSPIRTVKELSCILLFSLSSVNVIGKYVNNSSAVSFLVCFLLFFCFFFCWEGVGEKV